MLDDSSRSAALRRPQSGTPEPPSSKADGRTDLVGDFFLLDLGWESPQAAVLCAVLLKVQIGTYRATGHIISFADEYARRRIRTHSRRRFIPKMYCRCMRCGCLALLIDWCVARDLADDPLMAGRRFPAGGRQPVSTEFYKECTGGDKARDWLLLHE